MIDRRRLRSVVNLVLVIVGVFALAATSEAETEDYVTLPGDVIDLQAGQTARLDFLSVVDETDDKITSTSVVVRVDRLNDSFDEDLGALMIRFPGSDAADDWVPAASTQSCSCFGETAVEFRLAEDFSEAFFSFLWNVEVIVDFGTSPPSDSGLTLELTDQQHPQPGLRLIEGSVPTESVVVNRINVSTPEAGSGETWLQVTPTGISVLLQTSESTETLRPLDTREFLGPIHCVTYPCARSFVQVVASSGPYGSGPDFDPSFHDGGWRLVSNDPAAVIDMAPISMVADVTESRPAAVPWPDEDYTTLDWTVTVSVGHDPSFDELPPVLQLRASPIDLAEQVAVAVYQRVSAEGGAEEFSAPGDAVVTTIMKRDGDRWIQNFSWSFHAGGDEHEINRVVTASIYRDESASSGEPLDVTIDFGG